MTGTGHFIADDRAVPTDETVRALTADGFRPDPGTGGFPFRGPGVRGTVLTVYPGESVRFGLCGFAHDPSRPAQLGGSRGYLLGGTGDVPDAAALLAAFRRRGWADDPNEHD